MNCSNSSLVTTCSSIQKPSTSTRWAGRSLGCSAALPIVNLPPGIQTMPAGPGPPEREFVSAPVPTPDGAESVNASTSATDGRLGLMVALRFLPPTDSSPADGFIRTRELLHSTMGILAKFHFASSNAPARPRMEPQYSEWGETTGGRHCETTPNAISAKSLTRL